MQSNSNASEAEMFYMADEDRGQCCLYSEIDLEEQKSKTWLDAKSLVDEAEAKWEADNTYRCNGNYNDNYKNALKVCPYCGNPIKILEVKLNGKID